MKIGIGKVLSLIVIIFFLQDSSFTQVPYVPTPDTVVDAMLKLAHVTEHDIVYDLGCGDGRIVVMAAKKYGAHAVGIDNNPERIKDSWANAKQYEVTDMVDFREQNLFETNLRDASVVTLYLLTKINLELRPKLFKELKPGTRVVSHSFSMDTWAADSIRLVDDRYIYFWKIPVNASGMWDLKVKGSKKENNYLLRLDQVFQKVDGTLESGSRKEYISDAKLNDDKLEFYVKHNEKGKPVKMKFTGQLKEDELQGTIETAGGIRYGDFSAKRKTGTMKPLDPKIKGLQLN